MVVPFLFFCHVICYIVSNILRVIIYKYIKKKPLGLQSILDPLILDIVRCQIANYAYFMLLLISALAHGQLPFLLSQVIIFISVTLNNYMYGLCLYQTIAERRSKSAALRAALSKVGARARAALFKKDGSASGSGALKKG